MRPLLVFDLADGEVERIDIGDAAGAVDDAIGFRGLFGAVVGKDHPQFPVGGLDALDADAGLDADADALAFRGKARHRIGVHRRQELRQDLQDGDVRAGARIDMTEFERDDATADKDHRARQVRAHSTSRRK